MRLGGYMEMNFTCRAYHFPKTPAARNLAARVASSAKTRFIWESTPFRWNFPRSAKERNPSAPLGFYDPPNLARLCGYQVCRLRHLLEQGPPPSGTDLDTLPQLRGDRKGSRASFLANLDLKKHLLAKQNVPLSPARVVQGSGGAISKARPGVFDAETQPRSQIMFPVRNGNCQ